VKCHCSNTSATTSSLPLLLPVLQKRKQQILKSHQNTSIADAHGNDSFFESMEAFNIAAWQADEPQKLPAHTFYR
jgi:hypothetical protein